MGKKVLNVLGDFFWNVLIWVVIEFGFIFLLCGTNEYYMLFLGLPIAIVFCIFLREEKSIDLILRQLFLIIIGYIIIFVDVDAVGFSGMGEGFVGFFYLSGRFIILFVGIMVKIPRDN